jgi:DNA-directed RNA polymerase subunit RPC12/RpoP
MVGQQKTDGGEPKAHEPDWAFEAAIDTSTPEWVDKVPPELWKVGDVFFPIPPGQKGWSYMHSLEEKRYSGDSEKLNGWLAQGWNYGIACANDLIVIDVDEPRYLHDIIDGLPPTLYQKTGSREGYHIFYICPGFDTRQNLYSYECSECGIETPYWDKEFDEERDRDVYHCPECGKELGQADNKVHVGEVKADPHGYVVGPGSLHPSGNHYGPLKGDEILEVEKSDVYEEIEEFTVKESFVPNYENRPDPDPNQYDDRDGVYNLSPGDILPYLEAGNRIAHPVHGSSETNANFMIAEGHDVFVCWRCQVGGSDGCGLSPAQFLAAEELGERGIAGEYVCEDVRRRWHKDPKLHYYAWKRANQLELIEPNMIPYKILQGFALEKGMIMKEKQLPFQVKLDCINALEWLRDHGFDSVEEA